jgi:hypothetical protein
MIALKIFSRRKINQGICPTTLLHWEQNETLQNLSQPNIHQLFNLQHDPVRSEPWYRNSRIIGFKVGKIFRDLIINIYFSMDVKKSKKETIDYYNLKAFQYEKTNYKLEPEVSRMA